MNENLNQIQDASIKLGHNLIINFTTNESLTQDNEVILEYNNENHYFTVDKVRIKNDLLYIQAFETACSSITFDEMSDLDIRKLIGLTIKKRI